MSKKTFKEKVNFLLEDKGFDISYDYAPSLIKGDYVYVVVLEPSLKNLGDTPLLPNPEKCNWHLERLIPKYSEGYKNYITDFENIILDKGNDIDPSKIVNKIISYINNQNNKYNFDESKINKSKKVNKENKIEDMEIPF